MVPSCERQRTEWGVPGGGFVAPTVGRSGSGESVDDRGERIDRIEREAHVGDPQLLSLANQLIAELVDRADERMRRPERLSTCCTARSAMRCSLGS